MDVHKNSIIKCVICVSDIAKGFLKEDFKLSIDLVCLTTVGWEFHMDMGGKGRPDHKCDLGIVNRAELQETRHVKKSEIYWNTNVIF